MMGWASKTATVALFDFEQSEEDWRRFLGEVERMVEAEPDKFDARLLPVFGSAVPLRSES